MKKNFNIRYALEVETDEGKSIVATGRFYRKCGPNFIVGENSRINQAFATDPRNGQLITGPKNVSWLSYLSGAFWYKQKDRYYLQLWKDSKVHDLGSNCEHEEFEDYPYHFFRCFKKDGLDKLFIYDERLAKVYQINNVKNVINTGLNRGAVAVQFRKEVDGMDSQKYYLWFWKQNRTAPLGTYEQGSFFIAKEKDGRYRASIREGDSGANLTEKYYKKIERAETLYSGRYEGFSEGRLLWIDDEYCDVFFHRLIKSVCSKERIEITLVEAGLLGFSRTIWLKGTKTGSYQKLHEGWLCRESSNAVVTFDEVTRNYCLYEKRYDDKFELKCQEPKFEIEFRQWKIGDRIFSLTSSNYLDWEEKPKKEKPKKKRFGFF